METMEIGIWPDNVNLLEKTEEIIEKSRTARHQQTTFYEGLALFFAQGYITGKPTDKMYGMLSQQVA